MKSCCVNGALATANGEAELRRAWDGHYRAEAEVNGVRMQLMVDTGASLVLLPYEEVGALGIDVRTLDYSLPVTTANGKSTVAPVRLSSIKIGPIAVFDVEAAVAHPNQLGTALLGMSFLERLSETSFRGEKLIIFKYKPKKRYRRKTGHRQSLTRLAITAINA